MHLGHLEMVLDLLGRFGHGVEAAEFGCKRAGKATKAMEEQAIDANTQDETCIEG